MKAWSNLPPSDTPTKEPATASQPYTCSPTTLQDVATYNLMSVLYLLIAYQMCLPLAGLCATLSVAPATLGPWIVGLGFFPTILLIGITPKAVETPGHPLRAALLVLLVPLEILADCLWFGGTFTFFLVVGVFIEVVGAGLAIVLRVMVERPLDPLALFWSVLATSCAAVAYGGAVLTVYEGAALGHWIYLGVVLVTSVLSWGAFVHNSRDSLLGRRRSGQAEAPLIRALDRVWSDQRRPKRLSNPEPWVVGGVIGGMLAWVVIAVVML